MELPIRQSEYLIIPNGLVMDGSRPLSNRPKDPMTLYLSHCLTMTCISSAVLECPMALRLHGVCGVVAWAFQERLSGIGPRGSVGTDHPRGD